MSADETLEDLPTSFSVPNAGPPAGPLGRVLVGEAPRFTGLEEIARGGMGAIYRAHDEQTGRDVALKVILPDQAGSQRALQKFVVEAQITARLEHPSVVPVHDLTRSTDGTVFFTMKLVEGQSLAHLIESVARGREAWTHHQLLGIFGKICDALAHAHARGVLHRDLKPANIMVGEHGEVLVMDWGLAKVLGSDEPDTIEQAAPHLLADAPELTLDGTVLGTPGFMSPEQARGEVDSLDARSDIYALGAILYTMLTRSLPFLGIDAKEVIEANAEGQVQAPTWRAPALQIPRELEAVVLKAMALRPDDRYADVLALQADLAAYLDDRLVGAVRYTSWQLLQRFVRRHRGALLTAGAVLLATLIAGGGFAWHEAQEREEGARAARSAAGKALDTHPALPELRKALAGASDGRDWRKVLSAYLIGAGHLDRAMELSSDAEALHGERRDLGEALGLAAMLAGDYHLAEHAMMQLARWGVPPERIAQLSAQVAEARQRRRKEQLRQQAKRLQQLLAELASDGATLYTVEDAVVEASLFREEQTVRILGVALDTLTKRASRDRRWTKAERFHALFCCRVLGRIGQASAVAPLGRWLAATDDQELMVTCGIALCYTGSNAAREHLLELSRRVRMSSEVWRQVSPFMSRLPRDDLSKLETPEQFLGRGTLLYDQGQNREAIRCFDRCITLAPEMSKAYNNRANAYAALGQTDAALRDYAAAIRFDRLAVEPLISRGGLLFNVKRDVRGARADYDAAIRIAPGYALAYECRGILRLRTGELSGARADFDKAIKLDPKRAVPYVRRADLKRVQGKYAEALDDLAVALRIAPRLPLAHVSRALVRERQGQMRQALADYDRALELDPALVMAYYNRGTTLLNARRYAEAIADYTSALKHDPRHAMAYANRGNARCQLGEWRAALSDYDRAVQADPGLANAYLGRSRAHEHLGNATKAQRDMERAIALEPTFAATVHVRRANEHVRARRWREAIVEFERALKIKPAHADALLGSASCKAYLGDKRGALPLLDRVLALDPTWLRARYNRAMVRMDLRLLPGAISDFDKVIAADPKHVGAWRKRGVSKRLLGKSRAALLDLDRAAELAPRDYRTYFHRALAYGDLRRHDDAFADYDRALALEPKHAQSHVNRANVLRFRGDFAEALRGFDRALTLAPKLWNAHVGRGRTLAALGRTDEAIRQFQASLPLLPPAKRREIEGILRKLRGR